MKINLKDMLFEFESNKIHKQFLFEAEDELSGTENTESDQPTDSEADNSNQDKSSEENNQDENYFNYANTFHVDFQTAKLLSKSLAVLLNAKLKAQSIGSDIEKVKKEIQDSIDNNDEEKLDQISQKISEIPPLGKITKQVINTITNIDISSKNSNVGKVSLNPVEMIPNKSLKSLFTVQDLEIFKDIQTIFFVLQEEYNPSNGDYGRIAGAKSGDKEYFYVFAMPPLGTPIGDRSITSDSIDDLGPKDDLLSLHKELFGLEHDKENIHTSYNVIPFISIKAPEGENDTSKEWEDFKRKVKNKSFSGLSKIFNVQTSRKGTENTKSLDTSKKLTTDSHKKIKFSKYIHENNLYDYLFTKDFLIEYASQGDFLGLPSGQEYKTGGSDRVANVAIDGMRLGRGTNYWKDPRLDIWSPLVKNQFKLSGDLDRPALEDPTSPEWRDVVVKTGALHAEFRNDVVTLHKQIKTISKDATKQNDITQGAKDSASKAGGYAAAYYFLTSSLGSTVASGVALNAQAAVFGGAGATFFAGCMGPVLLSVGLPVAFVIGSKVTSAMGNALNDKISEWKTRIWDANLKNKFALTVTNETKILDIILDFASKKLVSLERPDHTHFPSAASFGSDRWDIPAGQTILNKNVPNVLKLMEAYDFSAAEKINANYSDLENIFMGKGLFCFRSETTSYTIFDRARKVLYEGLKGIFATYFNINLIDDKKNKQEITNDDLKEYTSESALEAYEDVLEKHKNIKFPTGPNDENKGQAGRLMYCIHAIKNSSLFFKKNLKSFMQMYCNEDQDLVDLITDEKTYETNTQISDRLFKILGVQIEKDDEEEKSVEPRKQSDTSGEAKTDKDKDKDQDQASEESDLSKIITADSINQVASILSQPEKLERNFNSKISSKNVTFKKYAQDLENKGIKEPLRFGEYILLHSEAFSTDEVINAQEHLEESTNLSNVVHKIVKRIVNDNGTPISEFKSDMSNEELLLCFSEVHCIIACILAHYSNKQIDDDRDFSSLMNDYIAITKEDANNCDILKGFEYQELDMQRLRSLYPWAFGQDLKESSSLFIYKKGLGFLLD